MKRIVSTAIMPAALLVFALLPHAKAAGVAGAIFTTTATGSAVNANQYTSKCDVYLDGGPGRNAPSHAAGLPAGEYFFQVTDPSGQTLVSTDAANNRQLLVSSSGVITAYSGFGGPPHPTGIDQDHPELGATTIALANTTCPADYLDTPNNGGVYKVWVTPVASFVGDPTQVDSDCGKGCYHGFVPSQSKTDNFKVKPATTLCVTMAKQLDNGAQPSTPGFNWQMQLTDPSGVTNNFFTNNTDGTVAVCGLAPGAYTVAEVNQPGFSLVALMVNGVNVSPQNGYTFTWSVGMPNQTVTFVNSGESLP